MIDFEDIIDEAFEKATLEGGDYGDYMDDAFEQITILEEEGE